MKLKHQTLESIGTVLWLLTDFIWMNGYCSAAVVLAIPTFVFLTAACIWYDGKKSSELSVLVASVCWFAMNAFWICSDIGYKEFYLWCAKITFLIACVFVYLAFRFSKKEKEPTDFKRLKIKS